MTLTNDEIDALGRIAETANATPREIIEIALRRLLAGEGMRVLLVRAGREEIATGDANGFDEVLDDIDRIISGGPMYDWERDGATLPVIVRHPEFVSGEPVYRGTRVPASTLFVHLGAGESLDEVLDGWPALNRPDCVAALEQAWRALSASAPTINDRDLEALERIRALRDESG